MAQQPLPPVPPAPLTLADVARLAQAADPGVVAARSAVAAAQARVGQVDAQGRPQLSFNSTGLVANGSVGQPPPGQETFSTLTNTLTLPLPVTGRVSAQRRAAQADLASSRIQLVVAARNAATSAETAYFDVLRQTAVRDASRQTLAQAVTNYDTAFKRFRDGAGAQIDVTRAQVPVLTAEGDLAAANANLSAAEGALNARIGRPADSPLSLAPVGVPAALTLLPSDAQTQAVQVSGDVQVARTAIRGAQAAIDVTRYAHAPVVELSASDIRSRDVTGFIRLDQAQVSLTAPLGDGGLAAQQRREADANLRSAEANLNVAQRAAQASALAAYAQAAAALARLGPATQAVAAAQTALDKTNEGYAAGLYAIRDVIDAQAALAQARLAQVQATYDAAAAEQALARLLGRDHL